MRFGKDDDGTFEADVGGCPHNNIVPVSPDWGKCLDCDPEGRDASFPLSAWAAGEPYDEEERESDRTLVALIAQRDQLEVEVATLKDEVRRLRAENDELRREVVLRR